MSFNNSYIDQLYIKLLIENNKYDDISMYISKVLDKDIINLLEEYKINDEKNKILQCIACIVADEYLIANNIFKELQNESKDFVICNTIRYNKIGYFIVKALNNDFESNKIQFTYDINLKEQNT